MKLNKSIFLLNLLLLQSFAHAAESWKRPEIPKDEIGRHKLETERATLHDKIIEAEKAKEEGKPVDEADLQLKIEQQKYIDTTLTTFDKWSSAETPAEKKAALDAGQAERNKISGEITIAEENQSGFNPSGGSSTNKPNFIETAYLKIKRFFKERQLKNALAKNSDIVQLNRLQTSLSDIYSKLNDTKAQTELEHLPLNFRPDAVVAHLKRFENSINDPNNDHITTEIQDYVRKYLKKVIESGIEFELENTRNKVEILNYQKNIREILTSMGIDEDTQNQALQSITNSLQQITPEAINRTVTDFFKNEGTNTLNAYNKLKQEALQAFTEFSPAINTKLQSLEKTLQDLFQTSNFADQLKDPREAIALNTFLSNEYSQLLKSYETYLTTNESNFSKDIVDERKINAQNKASISRQRALRATNDLEETVRKESQKLEQKLEANPDVEKEIKKNIQAKPIDETTKKMTTLLKNTIQRFEPLLTINLETAQKYLEDTIIKNLDTYINSVKQADPSREGIDTDQKIIDSVQELIHTLYDYAEDTPFLDSSDKNIIATLITDLFNRTFALNQERAKEFKDLLRELPNGTLIELPQSLKNPSNNVYKEPANKAVFDAVEQQITTNQPKEYKKLLNQVTEELEAKIKKSSDDGGF